MTITDPHQLTQLEVDYLVELRVHFEPAMLIYPTPFGTRIDAISSGGTATGPRFNGEVLAGGGDWLSMPADGIARMDVRATLRADSGDIVHYTSTGRVVLDDDARARFLTGGTLRAGDMYGRGAPLFETASERFAWLNGLAAAGVIAELSLHHICYQIYVIR